MQYASACTGRQLETYLHYCRHVYSINESNRRTTRYYATTRSTGAAADAEERHQPAPDHVTQMSGLLPAVDTVYVINSRPTITYTLVHATSITYVRHIPREQ